MIKLFKKIFNSNDGSVLIMVTAVMLSVVAVLSSASLMVFTVGIRIIPKQPIL